MHNLNIFKRIKSWLKKKKDTAGFPFTPGSKAGFGSHTTGFKEGGLSVVCVWLSATLWTVACQAPLSMWFFWQKYWSELPFHTPEDPPHPGIKPASPALAVGVFTTEASRSCSVSCSQTLYRNPTRRVLMSTLDRWENRLSKYEMPNLTSLCRDQPSSCWAPGLPDPQIHLSSLLLLPLSAWSRCWNGHRHGWRGGGRHPSASKHQSGDFPSKFWAGWMVLLKVINRSHLKEFTGENPNSKCT